MSRHYYDSYFIGEEAQTRNGEIHKLLLCNSLLKYDIFFCPDITKKKLIENYDEKNMVGRSVISLFYRKTERNITIKEYFIS